jgi:hypothetical protein
MISRDERTWNRGRADGMRGVPAKCPKGMNALSYANGYIAGKAPPEKYPLNSHPRLQGCAT